MTTQPATTISTSDRLAAVANAAGFILEAYRRVTADAGDERYVVAGRLIAARGATRHSAVIDLAAGELTGLAPITPRRLGNTVATALDARVIGAELIARQDAEVAR